MPRKCKYTAFPRRLPPTPWYDLCVQIIPHHHPAETSCRHGRSVWRTAVCAIGRLWCSRALSAGKAILCRETCLRLGSYLRLLPVNYHLLRVTGYASVACARDRGLWSAILGRTIVRTGHLTSRSRVSRSRPICRGCCYGTWFYWRACPCLWRAVHWCYVG